MRFFENFSEKCVREQRKARDFDWGNSRSTMSRIGNVPEQEFLGCGIVGEVPSRRIHGRTAGGIIGEGEAWHWVGFENSLIRRFHWFRLAELVWRRSPSRFLWRLLYKTNHLHAVIACWDKYLHLFKWLDTTSIELIPLAGLESWFIELLSDRSVHHLLLAEYLC